MRSGGHHLEPLGSRATLSAVRWVPFSLFFGSPRLEQQPPPPVAVSSERACVKTDSRARLRRARRAIDLQERQDQAFRAAEQIAQVPEWQDANVIASYFAMPEEFDPSTIDQRARELGKTVVFPRIVGNQLQFHPWQPGESTEVAVGVKQPSDIHPMVTAKALDLVLIPLVGADREGYRLGMGGGYYDRFLKSTHAFRLGLGFPCQRVDQLPREPHDQRLHGFLSGDGLERFRLEA